MDKTIKEMQEELWKTHCEKGWHTNKLTPLEHHALVTTEVAEATEAVRIGLDPVCVIDGKPEGELVELADAMIRIFNIFSERGADVETILELKNDYNKTRTFKHGKKL